MSFECFTAVILKRTDCRVESGFTATTVWCQLTAEEV